MRSILKHFLIGTTLLVGKSTWAHVVGEKKWCLQLTEIHFECFYDSKKECLDQLKLNSKKKKPKSFFDYKKEKPDKKWVIQCVSNPNQNSFQNPSDGLSPRMGDKFL